MSHKVHNGHVQCYKKLDDQVKYKTFIIIIGLVTYKRNALPIALGQKLNIYLYFTAFNF